MKTKMPFDTSTSVKLSGQPAGARQYSFWLKTAMLVAVVVGTGLLLSWTVRYADHQLRAELIVQARMTAEAVDIEHLEALTGTEADLTSHDYRHLKEQVARIRTACPHCRFIYLMGRKPDGRLFFFVDSEPADSPDCSPAGQVYDEASDSDRQVFATGRGTADGGPWRDRWGTWISALVPVFRPGTSEMLAALGMDVDARDWGWSVARRAAMPASLVALTVALVLFLLRLQRANGLVRHRETALRRSEERFRYISSSISDIAYSCFQKNGRYQLEWLTGAVEQVTGYTPLEMLDIGCWERLVHEEDQQLFRQHSLGLEPNTSGSCELRLRRKNGTEAFVTAFTQCVKEGGAAGRRMLYGGMMDNTTRKRLETEQTKLEQQLRQSQKLESIGRLAGGVAHDFNNLLTGILGNVSLALMDLKEDDPLYENLSDVRKAADSAATLTRQLLTFSRKQIVDPKVIDLNGLIANTQKMLVRLIGENISLKTALQPRPARVQVDINQLEQVLVNLVLNARDALPQGGNILIETAGVELDADYCGRHQDIPPGKYIRLSVSDNGCGMTPEVRQHIFEPFFSTKPKDKGTGLGLATVYGAVKQAHGSIEVYSEPGRGTTFKIYLPRMEGGYETIIESAPAQEIPLGTETVLLVEDEPIVRDLAARFLKKLGYQALVQASGEEALGATREYSGEIHLLMTDVIMPGMNGLMLARELLAIRPGVKVLLTSGYTENVIAERGELEPGMHFLGKPYTFQELAVKLREVLAGS